MIEPVFISYRHDPDGPYVERLAAHLQARGVPVWFDREIISGDRWHSVIQQRIDNASAVIVVMSNHSEHSRWVNREITRAEERDHLIFPVLLNGSCFFRLNDLQYENVTGGRLPSETFVAKLQAIVGATTRTADARYSEPPPMPRAAPREALAGPKQGTYDRVRNLGRIGDRASVDALMAELDSTEEVSLAKMVDFGLGEVSKQAGVDRIAHYLFKGSEIQRNYACIFFRRRGDFEILNRAVEAGAISRAVAFVN